MVEVSLALAMAKARLTLAEDSLLIFYCSKTMSYGMPPRNPSSKTCVKLMQLSQSAFCTDL